jgi:hypothetical protein
LIECTLNAEVTQPLTENDSNVAAQLDSPKTDATQSHPDTNIESNVVTVRVAAVEETEAATTIRASDPTTTYISQPHEAAKVLDTRTTSNAVSPANEDSISTECATTIEETEPVPSTTASDVAVPHISQPDKAAEVPTTSATPGPDPALDQGQKQGCHQDTTGTEQSKAREMKRKTTVQREESMKVSSKKRKTDIMGMGEPQQSKARGGKGKTTVQREESMKVSSKNCKTDTSIPVVRTSAR